ncbi:hypothetical protein RDABS01_022101 [Bienertia sinuspersici]
MTSEVDEPSKQPQSSPLFKKGWLKPFPFEKAYGALGEMWGSGEIILDNVESMGLDMGDNGGDNGIVNFIKTKIFGKIEIKAWQLFTDKLHLREVLRDYCIQSAFVVVVETTNNKKYTVRCNNERCY